MKDNKEKDEWGKGKEIGWPERKKRDKGKGVEKKRKR